MSKKALCIGINDYPGTQNNLKGCVNDANDWAAELTKRGFTVEKLLDTAATKAAINEKMSQLRQQAGPGDLLLVTFSGHGTYAPDHSSDEPDGKDEALCPTDYSINGPIFDDDIHALFSVGNPNVRIVFIADSCYSGSIIRGLENQSNPTRKIRFVSPDDWINHVPAASRQPTTKQARAQGVSRSSIDLLLAACPDDGYSCEDNINGRQNGYFTHYALQALNNSTPATYAAWFVEINKIFQEINTTYLLAVGGQHPQLFGEESAKSFKIFEEYVLPAPHITGIKIN